MKKVLLIVIMVLWCVPIRVYSQIYSGYVVKSMNNTFVIDIGADDNIPKSAQYKLYHHKKGKGKAKKKNDFAFLGIIEITQIFSDASVITFVSKKGDTYPKEGHYFSLIPVPETDSIEPDVSSAPMAAKPVIMDRAETISRKKDIIPARGEYAYSLSVGMVTGYGNFPKAVSKTIEDYLENEIYTQGNAINTSLPPKGGFSVNIERIVSRYTSLRLGYATLYYNRYLNSYIPGSVNPDALPDEYVKNWRYKIKTFINTASCDILFGKFGTPLYGKFRFRPHRGFVFYGGLGFDYASMSYNTNETITLHRYDRDDVVHDDNSRTLSGYWGIHGIAGMSYYFPSFRMYAEGGYTSWTKDILKSSYPLKLGVAVHF